MPDAAGPSDPLARFRALVQPETIAAPQPAPPVVGLLIEGVDYSGKTTVLDRLMARMADEGRPAFRRACFMHEHPIIDALLALAKTSDDMAFRDVCYTASLLLDLRLAPTAEPAGLRLQERHVQTQIGRNTFFYDDPHRWHVPMLRQLRRRFTCQVYLTSDLATKRLRAGLRPAKSPRDALLAADPRLHQRYDEAMRDGLPAGEAWLVLDTSRLDPDQTADRIMAHMAAANLIQTLVPKGSRPKGSRPEESRPEGGRAAYGA